MDFTKLKNCLDKFINEYNTPGVDCIVYKEHKPIFRYFAGMSDIENGRKMCGNELYIIFSMTKMLTCTGALQLFEQGKFIMSDPVSKFLPEFERMKITRDALDAEAALAIASGKSQGESVNANVDGYAKRPITMKDLFTMGAGLDYDLGAPAIREAIAQGKTSTRELVRAMSETVLGFEPGTRYRYSLCHDVLGAVIEVISGQKLGDYMRENIFKPLGMNDTFYGLPKTEEQLERTAARYTYNEDRQPILQPFGCQYILSDDYESGGAGVTSSAEDYAVFLDMLANGGISKDGVRILSSATVELMGMNHLTGEQCKDFDATRSGYGYGLGVRTHIDKAKSGNLSPIGEFGWDGAAGAFSMVDTKNKLSLTYFQEVHCWDLRIQTELRNTLYSCLD